MNSCSFLWEIVKSSIRNGNAFSFRFFFCFVFWRGIGYYFLRDRNNSQLSFEIHMENCSYENRFKYKTRNEFTFNRSAVRPVEGIEILPQDIWQSSRFWFVCSILASGSFYLSCFRYASNVSVQKLNYFFFIIQIGGTHIFFF